MVKKSKVEKLLYSMVIILMIVGLSLIFQNTQVQASEVSPKVPSQHVSQGQAIETKSINHTNTLNKLNEVKVNQSNVLTIQSDQNKVTHNNQGTAQNKQTSIPANKTIKTIATPVKTNTVTNNKAQTKPQIKISQNVQTASKAVQNKQPQKATKAVTNGKSKPIIQTSKSKNATVATKPRQNNSKKVINQKEKLSKTNTPTKSVKTNSKKVQSTKKVTTNKKSSTSTNKKKVKPITKTK